MQISGQPKQRIKSTTKKVNERSAAEFAGQGWLALTSVKNPFLTKGPHAWACGSLLRNARVAKKEKAKKGKEAEATEAPEGEEAVDGAEGEAASGKKKLPLKMLIIVGAATLVVLGGGGGAAFFLLKPKPDAEHAEKGHEKEKKEKKKEKKGEEKGESAAMVREGPDGIVYYTLPEVVVNMQTADGRPTFLKLKLTLELPDEGAVEELDRKSTRLNSSHPVSSRMPSSA